jgi:hypothetical protein
MSARGSSATCNCPGSACARAPRLAQALGDSAAWASPPPRCGVGRGSRRRIRQIMITRHLSAITRHLSAAPVCLSRRVICNGGQGIGWRDCARAAIVHVRQCAGARDGRARMRMCWRERPRGEVRVCSAHVRHNYAAQERAGPGAGARLRPHDSDVGAGSGGGETESWLRTSGHRGGSGRRGAG